VNADPLPSSVYLLQISAGDHSLMKKILVSH